MRAAAVARGAARRPGGSRGPRSVAVAMLVAGCGSLPTNVGKTDTLALPAPTRRARSSRSPSVRRPSPEQTGVRLLPLGAYSLDARIQLAQRATTSLDVQYYVLEARSPPVGSCSSSLRDASQRGVRVRLLVDDLYTTHSDPAAARAGVVPERRGAASSTRSAATAAPAPAAATRRRSSTSPAQTTACTTSSSSPTA
jgi:phosphatidylserine/phosphatidylglycerophosphate/cardiolipin synthase-like enzyme